MSLHLSNRGLKHLILALVATFTFSSSLFADPKLKTQLLVVERIMTSSAVRSPETFDRALKDLNIIRNYLGVNNGTGRYLLTFQKLIDRLASIDRLLATGTYNQERLIEIRHRIAEILDEVGKSARHLKLTSELSEKEEEEELKQFRSSLRSRLNSGKNYSSETIGSIILGLSFVNVRSETIAKISKLYQESSDPILRGKIETSFNRWKLNGVIGKISVFLGKKPQVAKAESSNQSNEVIAHSAKKETNKPASLAGLDLFFDAKAAINTRLLAAQLISAQLSEILPSMPDSEIADLQLNLMVTIAEQLEPQDILRAVALMLLQTSSYTPDKTFNREFLSFVLLAGQNSFKDVVISQAIANYAQNILQAEKSPNTEINHDFFVSCAEAYKTGK